ncbi:sugar ABC transporter permease [Acutalibacter muris]|jgi:putative aldouronate transport system permease protein|uniref:Sugar ABC transporter permease n=1 Tax=Acutalibacter muris TaxID=1796620 RepID=A0A1Z2XU84_9FIRM|nr:ABC transporter permease subunit [Acutalibacter muris]ANU54779.1 sugar ABC transporter permease [Hungateiclostridiaceae bacterium KB18]ASB41993.1 sugar ABC transporter permease [Acutalibacter muris]MCI9193749.1 sugar ABC transporter permease [Acutalibacter muris]MCI9544268.1 sugar ABC transporter permease [Acutalibacter muris]QQR31257.1 sugar ABC transporter permease [Acutalibacter muris]
MDKKKLTLARFKQYIPLYLMLLPGAVYLFINNYIPMTGIVVAFKTYNVNDGIYGSPWAGLKNFEFLFGTNEAAIIVRNTLLYNVAFIIVNMVVGIILAIFISDVVNNRMKKLYQSSILLPFLISIVVVSYIVFALLSHENGMFNKTLLPLLGLDPVQWYNDTTWWPLILIITNCWKGVGYGTLIYIAAIAGIDQSFYEAAELDGASKWQQITQITLPCLVPSIITLLIMNIGRIFYSDFGLFYQVPQNSGSLYSVTNTIDTYVYRALMSTGGIGRSSAAGLLQSVVGFTLVMVSNLVVRKASAENAIF